MIAMSRRWPEPVSVVEAECLILWPKGSAGWERERRAIDLLIELCLAHGFGRIPQLAEQIEKLWREPETRDGFLEHQQDFLKWVSGGCADEWKAGEAQGGQVQGLQPPVRGPEPDPRP